MHIEEPQQPLEESKQPKEVNKGGKKEPNRKLSLKKKCKEISE